MEQHTERFGTFSSSSMWKLMEKDKAGTGFGQPAKKYIKQVNYERKLGRQINAERESRPTSWGKFVEGYVFGVLPLEYQLVSQERLIHPKYNFWTGAPDLKKENTVCDIKCPFNLEIFIDKVESLQDIELYKKLFPEDYWQHVSNSILTGLNYAEAIIFVPLKSQLIEIKDMAANYSGNQNGIAWINWAEDDELPYLKDEDQFLSLNRVTFEVDANDKDALEENIVKASKQLIEYPQPKEVVI